MKRNLQPQATILRGLVFLAAVACVNPAQAQLPWRWFGPRVVEKAPPLEKAMMPDSRRIAEVNVEIAWLADPITFPYYLEARVVNSQLEMRGYVPNKAVRDHALRLAQIYSSLPVNDVLKEHASLLVRPSTMSQQQLQNAVQSSLRVALPRQYQNLKIECREDGKVFVAGPVNTYDERIAVSHALRRLHGCTSVQNLTTLPAELAQVPPTLTPKAEIVKVSNPSEEKEGKPVVAVQDRPTATRSRWLLWPFNKTSATKEEPPLAEPMEPSEFRNTDSANAEKQVPAVALTPASLQKRVLTVCKLAKGADVQFPSTTAVRITVDIAAEKDVGPAAEAILAIPELRGYRPELLFKVVSP